MNQIETARRMLRALRHPRMAVGKLHARMLERLWRRCLRRNLLSQRLVLTDSSMLPDDLLLIEQAIEAHATTKLLVELGSGVSSVFLSKLMGRLGGCMISVEAEERWFDETKAQLRKHHCRDCALIFAPYRSYGPFNWFDLKPIDAALGGRPIDILIIDAPPGDSARFARAPGFELMRPRLRLDALVFLHDTIRDDEREMVRQWAIKFHRTAIYHTEKGLTAFWRPKDDGAMT